MRAALVLSIVASTVVLTFQPASASITHLAAADRAAVMRQKFDIVHNVSAIPKPVKDEFAHAVQAGVFSMANPDQPFQSSDSSSANLPFYRLVFAASNEDYYLIEALRGGSSPGSEVFLFKLDASKSADAPLIIHQVPGGAMHSTGVMVFDHTPAAAKLVWSAVEQQSGGDLDGIRKAIAADKMSDSDADLADDRNKQQQTAPNIGNPMMPGVSASF